MAPRLVERVYGADGKPSKWWMAFQVGLAGQLYLRTDTDMLLCAETTLHEQVFVRTVASSPSISVVVLEMIMTGQADQSIILYKAVFPIYQLPLRERRLVPVAMPSPPSFPHVQRTACLIHTTQLAFLPLRHCPQLPFLLSFGSSAPSCRLSLPRWALGTMTCPTKSTAPGSTSKRYSGSLQRLYRIKDTSMSLQKVRCCFVRKIVAKYVDGQADPPSTWSGTAHAGIQT